MYLEFVLIRTGDTQAARMVVMKETYIHRFPRNRRQCTLQNPWESIGQEAVDSSPATFLRPSWASMGEASCIH